MDSKFEQLVSEAEFALFVMGNQDCSEFALMDFGPLSGESCKQIVERGISQFVGVVGIVKGTPRCALNVLLDDSARSALSDGFVRALTERYGDALKDHFAQNADVGFLEALYALPDPRVN